MIRIRVLFGLLMILAVAGMFWGDTYLAAHHEIHWAPLFFLVVTLLTIGGAYELTAMLNQRSWRIRWWLTVPASAGLIVAAAVAWRGYMVVWYAGQLAMGPTMVILTVLLLAVLVLEVLRTARTGDFETPLGTICGTMLVPMYVGMLMLTVVAIRFLAVPDGLYSLILFLAVCKLSDVGAYFTGKAVGRHKMVPRLSPGKTWEGLAGGIGLSLAAALVIGMALTGLAWYEAAVFGLAVAVASVIGDLAESLLKRSCGKKDSGQMVPEFGGVLDIVDSILVSAPVAYVLLLCFGGGH